VPEALIDSKLLEKLERLTIHWQKSLPGLVGGHNTSRFAGAGQEFLDHRHFHQGDDLRAVNWRAFLRLEKLFLKMFQLEPRIPVRLLLDISKSMETGDGVKFDYARKLAAALCYVGLVRLDTICLQPFAEKMSDAFTASGGRHRFQPALNYLTALKAGGHTNFLQTARGGVVLDGRHECRQVRRIEQEGLDACWPPLEESKNRAPVELRMNTSINRSP
jgi:uncharacterized protein (DUF58 family)